MGKRASPPAPLDAKEEKISCMPYSLNIGAEGGRGEKLLTHNQPRCLNFTTQNLWVIFTA